ncbi:MAG TPA: ABC transporter ATP-binding protein [Acidobacteriota bacterium]
MIRCAQLTKRYGDLVAVDRLDLEIPRGELFGFLGPNGAGKTTTIKILTGLLRPTSGRASIGPYDLSLQPLEAKRITGYVPDTPALYEKLTPMELMEFIGEMYGMSRAAYLARAAELLEGFELGAERNDLIESYSHGMRQKVALAAALLHNPELLILDEPMVALDPHGARQIRELLKAQCRAGTTVFISTHTLPVAEELCDRIGIIHRGRLVAVGTMDQLRELARAPARRLEEVFLALTHEEREDARLRPAALA